MATASDDSPNARRDLETILGSFIEEQRKVNDELRGFFKQADRRYETISEDLGILKGGYAFNTVLGNASRIANKLGYQFISQLPEQELGAFANLVIAAGETSGEVESFRNADMVLLVQDSTGQPYYIAIEVSYTVNSEDIRRAKRNAEYLQRLTTMPSRAAVVGVHIPDTIRHLADASNVLWYLERPT